MQGITEQLTVGYAKQILKWTKIQKYFLFLQSIIYKEVKFAQNYELLKILLFKPVIYLKIKLFISFGLKKIQTRVDETYFENTVNASLLQFQKIQNKNLKIKIPFYTQFLATFSTYLINQGGLKPKLGWTNVD